MKEDSMNKWMMLGFLLLGMVVLGMADDNLSMSKRSLQLQYGHCYEGKCWKWVGDGNDWCYVAEDDSSASSSSYDYDYDYGTHRPVGCTVDSQCKDFLDNDCYSEVKRGWKGRGK